LRIQRRKRKQRIFGNAIKGRAEEKGETEGGKRRQGKGGREVNVPKSSCKGLCFMRAVTKRIFFFEKG
jgi:hypothetical protein